MKNIKNIITSSLLALFLVTIFNFKAIDSKKINSKIKKELNTIVEKAVYIKTDMNQFDISPNDKCVYLQLKINNISSGYIICQSGKVFKDIKTVEGSSTGTPGHLMYKNYIGYSLPESNKKKFMPGQARRVTYCVGNCVSN